MKKAICIICVFAMLFTVNSFAFAASSDAIDSGTIPDRMQPGTVIIYDDDLSPQIVQGGYAATRSNTAKPSFELQLVDIPEAASEEDAALIELQNQIAIEQYQNFVSGNMYSEPSRSIYAGMKVEYSSITGELNQIYYPDSSNLGKFTTCIPDEECEAIRSAAASTTQWVWGAHNNTLTYQAASDSFLGTGRATFYNGGPYGNRNNILKEYDCATSMTYDMSKKGDQDVQIRNLDTDKVYTYYQADVGGLPDAIVDIWGVKGVNANIRELAGTAAGQPTNNANNVRTFHYRFSDQTKPG